jgi:hypothetical protein
LRSISFAVQAPRPRHKNLHYWFIEKISALQPHNFNNCGIVELFSGYCFHPENGFRAE